MLALSATWNYILVAALALPFVILTVWWAGGTALMVMQAVLGVLAWLFGHIAAGCGWLLDRVGMGQPR